MEPVQITSQQVTQWYKTGFDIFKKMPGILILFTISELTINWLTGMVPLLGFAVSLVVSSLLTASWFLIAQKIEFNQTLEFNDIFLGFKDKAGPLVIFTLVYMFFIFVSFVPTLLTIGVGVIISFLKTKAFAMPSFTVGIVLATVLSTLSLLVVLTSITFAIPLIIFKNTEPLEAMKLSLEAWLKNLGSLSWGILICLGLYILIIPTLGLGVLVVFPIIKLAAYSAYKALFEQSQITS
ncbi:MAG: hypothetical protein IPM57_00940 [Oligoflexia bacterium]|nr:hypothetical protein [Oligoflexia bacterium]